jgi:hypothetical protein
LICGTAADVFADVFVEDGVVDEPHAETETTSPNESNALIIAKDLRPVPIDFPSVDDATPIAHGRIATLSRSSAAAQGRVIEL